jgi:MFS family permease
MFDWIRSLNSQERKTIVAALAGWSVDALDYMVYTFVISTLMAAWGMTKAQAGLVATASLVLSAVGGWIAGILADRFGRVRILQVTIVWFAVCTFACGFTNSFYQLLACRALQGLGFGGEWAVGSVLIGEMIRAEHRGKAVGTVQSGWAIGWGAAAILFAISFSVLPEQWAWRALFWIGLAPALLVIYIRRNVSDPQLFNATRSRATSSAAGFLEIFSPQLLRTTIAASLLATGLMASYYAITTWVPTYLKTVRHLSVLGTGWYTFVIIAGSFIGYIVAAYLNDHIGRRKTFALFALCTGAVAIAYTLIPISDAVMLVLGFPLGFFLSGNFSGFGPFLTELLPSRVRGSGQGFIYNFGRGFGAFAPPLVGRLATDMPLSTAIGWVSGCALVLSLIALSLLPETRGKELLVYD